MEKIKESKELWGFAQSEIKPAKTFICVSGGNDSMSAYLVSKEIGIKIDGVIHIKTGTGVQETTDFVRNFARNENLSYYEGCNFEKFRKRVLKFGLFGQGKTAHLYAYHILKKTPLDKIISSIRQRKRNFPIILLNGVRRTESNNRMQNIGSEPVRKWGNQFWVNIINEFSKEDCKQIIEANPKFQNPVTKQLCRSGECMCGTMQSKGDFAEFSALYPKSAKVMYDLEKKAKSLGFYWGLCEKVPKKVTDWKYGQLDLFMKTPQFMCVGCNERINNTEKKEI